MTKLLKYMALAIALFVVTGCKLTIIADEGGSVVSQSGLRNCPKSTICPNEITSPTFTESFTAQPEPGYEFVRWQNGDGFWCGGSTNPTCTMTLAGSALDVAAIATFKVVYAMPVYEHVGIDTDSDGIRDELDEDDDNDGVLDIDDVCPTDPDPNCALITDTIFVNGKEWAQIDLFTNLSWYDVAAVCPDGPCLNNGMLNGHDMTGWTWASLYEVHALFNHYSGGNPTFGGFGPYGELHIYGTSSAWAPRIFDDGMRPTDEDGSFYQTVDGWTRETALWDALAYGYRVRDDRETDSLNLDNHNKADQLSDMGAWFYRNL